MNASGLEPQAPAGTGSDDTTENPLGTPRPVKRLCIAAFLVFTLSSIGVLALVIDRQYDLLRDAGPETVWTTSQLQTELLRFARALASLDEPAEADAIDELLLRYDIVVNRMSVLYGQGLRPLFAAAPQLGQTLAHLREVVLGAEAVVDGLIRGDTTGKAELEAQLLALEPMAVAFASTLAQVDTERRDAERNGLVRLYLALSACFAGVMASVAAFMVVLAQQVRRARLALDARGAALCSLHDSEQRFRDFADTTADWLWETDATLHFRYVSDRRVCPRGMRPEQLLGGSRAQLGAAVGNEGDEAWQQHREDIAARRAFRDFRYTPEHAGEDGTAVCWSISGRPYHDAEGNFAGYRGTATDITESQALARRAAWQAAHDDLTGLVNRRGFAQRLQRVLATAHEYGGEHALCYLDLDQFKVINDTCGHVAGDQLLRQIAVVLSDALRKRDTIARLGGDEFGVLIEHCDIEDAHRVTEALRSAVENFRFTWEGRSFTLGVSIGMVPIDSESPSAAALMSAADTACYTAKEQGRNRIHVYDGEDGEVARRHGEMRWVTRIHHALDEGRFRLMYQPVRALGDGDDDRLHYELLLRMLDENGVEVEPGAFLPAAERYGLATRVDRWVVGAALDWLESQPEHLARLRLCSINLSGHSLVDPGMLEFVRERIASGRVPAHKLCFEITETAAIGNLNAATRFIDSLRGIGCRFALDDFGSGLASFAYIRNLNVDFLKIDGMFVRGMSVSAMDEAIVRAISEIGHVSGKRTIAEFVENESALVHLRDLGVDYAQGYAIGRPQPLHHLVAEPPAIAVRIGGA